MRKHRRGFAKALKYMACVLPVFWGSSCMDRLKETVEGKENPVQDFKFWTWITADASRTEASYKEEFAKYKENGFDAVLINTEADPKLLERLAPLAIDQGLEVHAWMFTINRPNDHVAREHPEWYAVSREGKSCYDHPPYVDYYQWMCPTREGSRQHILNLVEGLARVDGITSVHLDYIRYSDIFLPIGLLPKYNLKQEVELPEYDFCYCEVCISEFEKIHHKSPLEAGNTAIDMEWKQFRLNKVKAIVDDAFKIAHSYDKILTAAVFPYPEMADHMVRQRWDKWHIDAVLPMIYHNFYNEELDWIGYATKQGVHDLEGKGVALHTGLFVPEMTADDLARAISFARENGAAGVSLFDGPAITSEQLAVVRNFQE